MFGMIKCFQKPGWLYTFYTISILNICSLNSELISVRGIMLPLIACLFLKLRKYEYICEVNSNIECLR